MKSVQSKYSHVLKVNDELTVLIRHTHVTSILLRLEGDLQLAGFDVDVRARRREIEVAEWEASGALRDLGVQLE